MSKTAKKENYDVRAVSVVRRLASKEAKEAIYGGLVSNAEMAWLYQHAQQLAKEVIEPVLKRKCPPVAISVEKLSKKRLGEFRVGRDGLGLKWRVALNIVHFARPRFDLLRTVLHEELHCVQHEGVKKTKSHHDREFRDWSDLVGIPCDKKGISTGIVPDGPFDRYCKKHGIEGQAGLLTKKEAPKPKGSTLRKFSCPCGINVRVGSDELSATCNLCEGEFALNEA